MPKERKHLWVAVLAALGLLFAAALPAGAVAGETGAGEGTGEEVTTTDPVGPGFCVRVAPQNTTIDIDHTGTYTATDSTGKSVYAGATHATVQNTAEYWISPAGTWANSGCTTRAGVAVKVEIDSVPAGSVACPPTGTASGTYSRVGENTLITFDAACKVKDNVTPGGIGVERTSPTNTTHTFEGVLQPCGIVPCPPVISYAGTYTET